MFVHGLDLEGNMVTDADYKERGRCLAHIFQRAKGQNIAEGRGWRGKSGVGSILILIGAREF